MDVKTVKDEAMRATERTLAERLGVAPDPDSDEWEDEYRRQFELAKRRHAAGGTQTASRVAEGPDALPHLTGTPADERWAHTIRAQRLGEIGDTELRAWVVQAWTTAKAWIDSRDVAPAAFLRRIEAQYADHRRRAETQSAADATARQTRAEAAQVLARKVAKAGISAAALIELIDLSERLKPAGLGAKLAEVTEGTRSLRVFLSDDPARLMVLEKHEAERRQYAIPNDSGLVADLKLYAESQAMK